MAHRGGSWTIDNSISNFKASVENKVEGVETDVWITKDGIPMVLHGDNDGQLTLYGLQNEFVYDWTSEDLIKNVKLPNGEDMPTLKEFLDVYAGTETLINIELKGPLSLERK